MIYLLSLIVWITLAYSSAPVSGRPTEGETVLFLGPGVATDGRSQVLSLPDMASITTNIKPHPFQRIWSDGSVDSMHAISGTVATVVDEKLVVCGGQTASLHGEDVPLEDTMPVVLDKCYTLTDGTKWTPSPSMLKKRSGAAAAKTSEGWWVTGGSDDTSTEILKNGSWVVGPELPQAVNCHCLLRLDQDHYLLVGGGVKVGEDKYDSANAYIIRHDGGHSQLEGTPPMGMASACAMLGNAAYIAGGADHKSNEGITKVHIWSDGKWKEGPELPKALAGAAMVAYDNHLYIFGGMNMGVDRNYNDIVYKLDNGEWTAVGHVWNGLFFPAVLISEPISH